MKISVSNSANSFLLSYSVLIELGISRKTIEAWKSRGSVESKSEKGRSYIYYCQIPERTKKKLPPETILHDLVREQKDSSLVSIIYNNLRKADLEKTPTYRNYYSLNPCLTPDKILTTARLHSVLERLIQEQQGRGWLKAAFKAFWKIFPGKYKSYHSFFNAISRAKKNGVENVAYDDRLVREKKQMYDDKIYTWLRALIALPTKLTNKEIGKKIIALANEAGIKDIPTNSEEWVKKHRRELLKNNHELYLSRYGSQETKKIEPYAKIISAKNPLSQVQVDGFTIPVYFKNEKTSWAKIIVFAVLDSHSKMIIGYSFGESEGTKIILDGLNDAVSKTGYIPYQIVSDNHSANKTDELKFFKQELSNYGVTWTVTENPQFKNKIERTFKHINENYFKSIPGWTGQGVLTRDKEGKPSQEYIDHYQKADNKRTKEEIIAFAIKSIEDYNNTPLPNQTQSPKQIFEAVEKKYATKITVFDRAKIFIACKKSKVERGQINITKKGVKHEFQLNADLMSKYNNQEVLVRYEDLNECIYLYDLKKDLPIGEVKPKTGIHGALADQTEEDKIKLLKHKGRVKGYKTKAVKENEKYAHPDAAIHLNKVTTPKDIIKELQENSELRRLAADHGVDANRMTTGLNNKNFIQKSLLPKEQIKKSPFYSESKTLERININEE